MGGWIACCCWRSGATGAGEALIGIAAAPDFTEDLIWAILPTNRARLVRDGRPEVRVFIIAFHHLSRRLSRSADHLLLRSTIAIDAPVRLL